MGYKIDYSEGIIRKSEIKTAFVKLTGKQISLIVMVLFVLAACAVGRQRWERLLIPGNVEVTKAAISNMITDIKTGEPVVDAITSFCKEIIDYADIQ